jgi:hypothetical protein
LSANGNNQDSKRPTKRSQSLLGWSQKLVRAISLQQFALLDWSRQLTWLGFNIMECGSVPAKSPRLRVIAAKQQ